MPDNPHGFDDGELQEHRDAEVAPRKQTAKVVDPAEAAADEIVTAWKVVSPDPSGDTEERVEPSELAAIIRRHLSEREAKLVEAAKYAESVFRAHNDTGSHSLGMANAVDDLHEALAAYPSPSQLKQ